MSGSAINANSSPDSCTFVFSSNAGSFPFSIGKQSSTTGSILRCCRYSSYRLQETIPVLNIGVPTWNGSVITNRQAS